MLHNWYHTEYISCNVFFPFNTRFSGCSYIDLQRSLVYHLMQLILILCPHESHISLSGQPRQRTMVSGYTIEINLPQSWRLEAKIKVSAGMVMGLPGSLQVTVPLSLPVTYLLYEGASSTGWVYLKDPILTHIISLKKLISRYIISWGLMS